MEKVLSAFSGKLLQVDAQYQQLQNQLQILSTFCICIKL